MNIISIAVITLSIFEVGQESDFMKKFDQPLLATESVALLIEEGYQHGFVGISAAFTPGEPVGELKQSFGNGLKQIRLSSMLPFDQVRDEIVVTRTSLNQCIAEYGNARYDVQIPSLIKGIREYTSKQRHSIVIKVVFTGRLKLISWYLYLTVNDNKNWRVDFASPILTAPVSAGVFSCAPGEITHRFAAVFLPRIYSVVIELICTPGRNRTYDLDVRTVLL